MHTCKSTNDIDCLYTCKELAPKNLPLFHCLGNYLIARSNVQNPQHFRLRLRPNGALSWYPSVKLPLCQRLGVVRTKDSVQLPTLSQLSNATLRSSLEVANLSMNKREQRHNNDPVPERQVSSSAGF